MTAGTTRDPATVGPYRLVRKLGEGGMGVVHLATDPAGRAVALKVLRAHVANDAEARRRLTREVDTLRRVRHPRVAEVLDADVAGEEPYLVTRYVPGRSLEEEVRSVGPLPAGQVARVGRALAGAIAAIHAAGVVHRDVKPANVMLVDGDPVLIDFGIAHVADESRITRTGLVMGTPGYLSPELIYGGAVTDATDWWAWGATLAFAATGRQPFGSGPIEVVLERVRRGQSDLDGVEPGLRELLAATLTVDSDRRLSSAELLRRLDDVIAGVTTAPSVVDDRGRLLAPPDDPTHRTAPPPRTGPPPVRPTPRTPGPTTANPPVDRTTRMPPTGGAPGAAIPPYPGAARPGAQLPPVRRPQPQPQPQSQSQPQPQRAQPQPPQPQSPQRAQPQPQQPQSPQRAQPQPQQPRSPQQPQQPRSPQQPQSRLGGRGNRQPPPYPYPHPQPTQQPPYPQAQPGRGPAPYATPYGAPTGQPPYPHQVPYGAVPYPQGWADERAAGGRRSRRQAPQQTPQQPWHPSGAHPAGASDEAARVTGTLAAFALALSAVAAVAPGSAIVLALGLSVLARLVQRSSAGLQRRRQELGGPRSTDVAVIVAALPWRFVMALVMSVLTLVLPALVATSTAFIVGALAAQSGGGAPHPTGAIALFAGMLAGCLTAWWGPGGWSLRTGSRAVVRAVTRGRGGRVAVASLCLLLVVAAAMVAGRSSYSPDWTPFPPPTVLAG